jgi:hypothetical protein
MRRSSPSVTIRSMIKRSLLGLAASAIVVAAAPLAAQERPDATFELSAGAFEPGAGYAWTGGTLYYRGVSYLFRVSGLTATGIDAEVQAGGAVYNLDTPEDFDGFYTEPDLLPGAAPGDLENERGVVIRLAPASTPEQVSSLLGMQISLERRP